MMNRQNLKHKHFGFLNLFLLILCLTALMLTACGHQTAATHQTAQHQSKHDQGPHQSFADIDRWVEIFESPGREQWQKPDEVIQNLHLRPGDQVADLGAGTGYFTRRIAVAVGPKGRALGLDIEPEMVDYMKKDAQKLALTQYEPRLIDANDPHLPHESMDLIFISNTYHHLQDRIAYLVRLRHALKPAGRIVVVDFYKWSLPLGPPPKGKLAHAEVKDEFQQAGYRLMRRENFMDYQYFLEFEREANTR